MSVHDVSNSVIEYTVQWLGFKGNCCLTGNRISIKKRCIKIHTINAIIFTTSKNYKVYLSEYKKVNLHYRFPP